MKRLWNVRCGWVGTIIVMVAMTACGNSKQSDVPKRSPSEIKSDDEPVTAKVFSGYDPRIEHYCQTSTAPTLKIERLAEYCEFLKDETRHAGCHWDLRKLEFDRNHCAGAFSPTPQPPQVQPRATEQAPAPASSPTAEPTVEPTVAPSVEPTVEPSTEPSPTETPTSTPTDVVTPAPSGTSTPAPEPTQAPVLDKKTAITQALNQAGIRLVIAGPLASSRRLEDFWPTLDTVLSDIIRRSPMIHQLTITTTTRYNSATQDLTLSLNLKSQEILNILSTFDRQVGWETRTGILLDFGTENSSRIEKKLAYLEQHELDLQAIRGAVHRIEFQVYGRYWLNDRKLFVSSENFGDSIPQLLDVLKPAASFLDYCDSQGLRVKGEVDALGDPSRFATLIALLDSSRAELTWLLNHGVLQGIELDPFSIKSVMLHAPLRLQIAVYGPDLNLLPSTLRALMTQNTLSQSLGITIDLDGTNLDDHFLQAVERLERRAEIISRKSGMIRVIRFGTRSSFEEGILTIGADDTPNQLDSIIARIN